MAVTPRHQGESLAQAGTGTESCASLTFKKGHLSRPARPSTSLSSLEPSGKGARGEAHSSQLHVPGLSLPLRCLTAQSRSCKFIKEVKSSSTLNVKFAQLKQYRPPEIL